MSSIADLLQTNGDFGMRQAIQATGGFVLGVVTENGDKENPGMVKVEFTAWEEQKNICDWIPCLRHYAGKEYGEYAMPEVGDQVVVGFLGTGPKKPFILGGFYPAGAQMVKDSFDEKNRTKRLRTKGGVEVLISDEDKKQQITVTTPQGLTIMAEDANQTITVADKNKENKLFLDCKKGAVELVGKSSVFIKAGNCEIKLDGQGGALSISGGRLEISADQTAKLAGQQMMTVEGGMLKLEGKQTAALKGGTMTEVGGGIIKLN